MTSPAPIQVSPLAPIACGAFLWRQGTASGATVVVKATFGLAHEANARLIAPAEIVREDRYSQGGSLEEASELAPYLPGAGVLLAGAAHAPGGHPTPAVSVRLGLTRERPLLNKVLHVIGNRTPESRLNPQPFEAMPVAYERAFGGSGIDDNPVGTGAAPGSQLPNVVDPVDPHRPAGFGPVARHWGPRRRLLGAADLRTIDLAVPEIPPGFDWSWFHAAPQDQRIDALRGDEWIVLDGLHPSLPRLQTRLPSARAHARWHLAGPTGPGPSRPVEMVADTLVITPETGACSLIWRGHVMLDGADAARVAFVAGIEMAGYPLAAALAAAARPDSGHEEPATHVDQGPTEKVSTGALTSGEAATAAAPPIQGSPRAVADEDEDPHTQMIDFGALGAKALAPFVLAEPRARPAPLPPLPLPGAPWSALVAEPAAQAPADNHAQTTFTTSPAMRTGLPFAAVSAHPFEPPPLSRPPPLPTSTHSARAIDVSPPGPLPLAPSMLLAPSAPLVPWTPPATPAEAPDEAPSARSTQPEAAPPAVLRSTVVAALAANEPLDGFELAGADLHDLDLRGRSLVRCKLKGANLAGATLAGAQLTEADLTEAVLDGADLAGATLTRASLEGASFKAASMAEVLLDGAHGRAVFDDARMMGASAGGAQLIRGSFKRVRAEGSAWERADLSEATLAEAKLKGANLERATCVKTDFSRADLTEADLKRLIGDGADLAGAKLDGANLRRAQMHEASFADVLMRKASADKADLSGSRFDRADLTGSSLRGAILRRAILAHTQLDGADLRDADLEQANMFGAAKQGAKMTGANMKDVSETNPERPA